MLLKTLIDIVITDMNLSKAEALKMLKEFIEEFARKEFGEHYKTENQRRIIKIFKQVDFLSVQLIYSCEDIMLTDNADSFDQNCVYCYKKINGDSKHIVNVFYKFDKKKTHQLYEEILSEVEENQFNEYLLDEYRKNFTNLKKNRQRIIPFIGAGLSLPFNLPNWQEMLLTMKDYLTGVKREYFVELVMDGDYMEAFTLLKEKSLLSTDRDIQELIVDLFEEKKRLEINGDKHNYLDLINLSSDFYLTTNYDYIFTELRNEFVPPLVWSEIENLQKFFINMKGSMIHLHGVLAKPSTMIVTKQTYESLYSNEMFETFLTSIMSNRVLLFIGFSFSDKFFKELYKNIYSKIKGDHYLIAPNIMFEDALELSREGLKVIGINVKKDCNGNLDQEDIVIGVRTILNELKR